MPWGEWVHHGFYSRISQVYSAVEDYIVSPLSTITRAIYNLQAVTNLREGFSRGFSLPRIPSFIGERQELIVDIVTTGSNYILWTTLPQTFLDQAIPNYIAETNPISFSLVPPLKVLIFLLSCRMFCRTFLDNIGFAISLSRVTSNDLSNETVIRLVEIILDNLDDYQKKLTGEGINKKEFFQYLFKQTKPEFEKIFFNANDDVICKDVIKKLSKIFSDTMKLLRLSGSEEILSKFSKVIAKVIVKEIRALFSEKFIKQISSAKNQNECYLHYFVGINEVSHDNRALLEKTLEEKYSQDFSKKYAKDFLEKSKLGMAQIAPKLPIRYIPSCSCEISKQVKAIPSSGYYYGLNLAVLEIASQFFPVTTLSKFIYITSKALICGQGIVEFLMKERCTADRYKIFAKNKLYSIGVGLACVMTIEGLERLLEFLLGGRNFFRSDAINSMVMLIMPIDILTNNYPLRGTEEQPLDFLSNIYCDFFSELKVRERKLIEYLHKKGMPNVEEPDGRKRCVEKFKKVCQSQVLNYMVLFLFYDMSFFPSRQTISDGIFLIKSFIQDLKKQPALIFLPQVEEISAVIRGSLSHLSGINIQLEISRSNIQLAIQSVKDMNKKAVQLSNQNAAQLPKSQLDIGPLKVLFQYPALSRIFRLYEKDLIQVILTVNRAQWWAGVLSARFMLPVSYVLPHVILLALEILTDEEFKEFFEKLSVAIGESKNMAKNDIPLLEEKRVTRDRGIALSPSSEAIMQSLLKDSSVTEEKKLFESPRKKVKNMFFVEDYWQSSPDASTRKQVVKQ